MKAATVCGAVPNMVSGWGLIDSHNTMSLPQSVIDNEMAAMLHRLHKPVEVSEATLSANAVAAVGPGGSFLGVKDTAKRIRAGEHYMPTLSNRLSYEKWSRRTASPRLDDCACAQVELKLGSARGPRRRTLTALSWTRSRPSAASTRRFCPAPGAGSGR